MIVGTEGKVLALEQTQHTTTAMRAMRAMRAMMMTMTMATAMVIALSFPRSRSQIRSTMCVMPVIGLDASLIRDYNLIAEIRGVSQYTDLGEFISRPQNHEHPRSSVPPSRGRNSCTQLFFIFRAKSLIIKPVDSVAQSEWGNPLPSWQIYQDCLVVHAY